jgi:hypothetical protein
LDHLFSYHGWYLISLDVTAISNFKKESISLLIGSFFI